MNRNRIIGASILVIALIVLGFIFNPFTCSLKKTTTTTQVAPPANPVVPPAKTITPPVQSAADSLAALKGTVDKQQQIIEKQIDAINKLIDKCGGNKVTTPRKTYQPPVKKGGNEKKVVIQDKKIVDGGGGINTGTGATNTVVSTTGNRLDAIYYEGNAKDILFCARLGGDQSRHLPHLAMLNGESFGDAQANNQSGFNWHVFKLADGPSGDYGVTSDGTFFIAKSLIDRYICDADRGIVEIKTTATGWQPRPMTLVGNYYTFKRK